MRLLKKLFKKSSISPGIVAISFLPHGFAIAITRYFDNNRPRLVHCEFVTASSQQLDPQLELLIREHKLEDYDCHLLLTANQYRTISVESPAVHGEEIKQALQWRVADFLDFPIDKATLDFYPLPKSNRANSQSMLEVVVCSNQIISSLTQQCRRAGLNLKVIDIQETALRNLATLLRENEQGVALLHLQKDGGRIIIQKRGELYLSRKLAGGYTHLDEDLGITEDNQLHLEQDSLAWKYNVPSTMLKTISIYRRLPAWRRC